jgi:hypothetical protein
MGFDVGGVTLTSPSGTTLSMDVAGVNWMSVNASGVLTRPQTPFMRGALHGKATASPWNSGTLLVTADVNFGGCWNNATGIWTCPVAGYYLATGGGIAATQHGYFYIRKNGVNAQWNHWNHTANWHYVSLSLIVPCAAGDTISYFLTAGSPTTTGFYGEVHGMYSIALLA